MKKQTVSPCYQSCNPYTETIEEVFPFVAEEDVRRALHRLEHGTKAWRNVPIMQRLDTLKTIRHKLEIGRDRYAALMCSEMGKPIQQGCAEIDKCIQLCEYYFENTTHMLASYSPLRLDPLGVILGIMPWNFPFWQVFRFAVPVLMIGNAVLIKPAENTPQSALAICDIFRETGIANTTFDTLFLSHNQTEDVIAHPAIQGISLTGSAKAGRHISALAGKHLKKTVLELGGSDPFIVCEDANLDAAVSAAHTSRFLNSGQTCIAAKRFLIHHSLFQAFSKALEKRMAKDQLGNPINPKTSIGPLARKDLLKTLEKQVKSSLEMGATCLFQHKNLDFKTGFFYPPTLLSDVSPSMPVFQEEVFGPVAVVCPFEDDTEAIRLANQTCYGLGASVWTSSRERASHYISNIETGSLFVNAIVKSSPELPFGGVKASGYGRELGQEGLSSFANLKTVVTHF